MMMLKIMTKVETVEYPPTQAQATPQPSVGIVNLKTYQLFFNQSSTP